MDGDRRHDIVRWHDDPSKNKLFLSNGDGTFRESSLMFGMIGNVQLKHSNGKYDIIVGDFTGNGFPEMLRVSAVAANPACTAGRIKLMTAWTRSLTSAGPDPLADPGQILGAGTVASLTDSVKRSAE